MSTQEYKQSDRRRAQRRESSKKISARYVGLKAQSKRRLILVAITFDEYKKIVESGVCWYCDASLPLTGHGLDRVDNRDGYTKANTKPCCKSCNTIKGRIEGLGFTYPRTVELMHEVLEIKKLIGARETKGLPVS